jgi:hypothetical protein
LPECKKHIGGQQSDTLDPGMDFQQAFHYLCPQPEKNIALTFKNLIADIYYLKPYLKPNGAGPALHFCNCGDRVSSKLSGKGLIRILCQHSWQLARKQGYRVMQFNLELSNHLAAVHL